MKKQEMKIFLAKLIRNSNNYNDVMFRFAEVVIEEHLGIDTRSFNLGQDVIVRGYPFVSKKKEIWEK